MLVELMIIILNMVWPHSDFRHKSEECHIVLERWIEVGRSKQKSVSSLVQEQMPKPWITLLPPKKRNIYRHFARMFCHPTVEKWWQFLKKQHLWRLRVGFWVPKPPIDSGPPSSGWSWVYIKIYQDTPIPYPLLGSSWIYLLVAYLMFIRNHAN